LLGIISVLVSPKAEEQKQVKISTTKSLGKKARQKIKTFFLQNRRKPFFVGVPLEGKKSTQLLYQFCCLQVICQNDVIGTQ